MIARLAVAGEPVDYITKVVSGPSPQLAMLRALALKAVTQAKRAWVWIRHGAKSILHAPGWIAQAVLSGLSTSAGYATATGVISTAVRFIHRITDKVVRGIGRAGMLTAYTVAGFLPGSWADKATTWIDQATTRVARAYTTHRSRVEGLGEHLLFLAYSPLVRTVATRAAATASALIVIHLITKGIVATHIAQTIPALATATVIVTSPWWALAGVGILTLAALAWAGIRLLRSTRTNDPNDDHQSFVTDLGETPANSTNGHMSQQANGFSDTELDGLTVDIGVDGSILVHGIPADLSEETQERLAHAAVAQMATAGPARPSSRNPGAARRRRR